MTVELWFNRNGGGTYHLIGKRPGCVDMNYQLAGTESSLSFGSNGAGGANVFTTVAVPAGEWVHVAGTSDGSQVRIYVNGVLRNSATGSLANENTAPLRIGTSGSCSRFSGLMDEVRIWSVARTDAEIAANYNQRVDPAAPGLVSYWSFDESLSDQNVVDLSPSGNNGTLGANASVGGDDPTRVASTTPINDCAPLCMCLCHADPTCDGFTDILDVVNSVNVAFRGFEPEIDPNANCPYQETDVDCTGFTDVIDVVKTVNVAFRGSPAAAEFCNPCP
jgi:hypothetical protein